MHAILFFILIAAKPGFNNNYSVSSLDAIDSRAAILDNIDAFHLVGGDIT